MTEHVLLFALVVESNNAQQAATKAYELLGHGLDEGVLTEWWHADDARWDRAADNDSAVFVPKGSQVAWTEVIHTATTGPRRRWFGAPRKRVKR
jgi:hypothetical protein